jgi:hypothetical protein
MKVGEVPQKLSAILSFLDRLFRPLLIHIMDMLSGFLELCLDKGANMRIDMNSIRSYAFESKFSLWLSNLGIIHQMQVIWAFIWDWIKKLAHMAWGQVSRPTLDTLALRTHGFLIVPHIITLCLGIRSLVLHCLGEHIFVRDRATLYRGSIICGLFSIWPQYFCLGRTITPGMPLFTIAPWIQSWFPTIAGRLGAGLNYISPYLVLEPQGSNEQLPGLFYTTARICSDTGLVYIRFLHYIILSYLARNILWIASELIFHQKDLAERNTHWGCYI